MCGKSENGPYSDGSHQGTGITPELVIFDKDQTIYACGWQQSNNLPCCDGSHNNLITEVKVTSSEVTETKTVKRWYRFVLRFPGSYLLEPNRTTQQ